MRLNQEQRAEVRRRLAEGASLRTLAREYGVSHTAISRYALDGQDGRDLRAGAKLAARWADVSQAAVLLGVTQEVVIARCVAGELRGAARLGDTWLVPRWLLAHRPLSD